MKGDEQKMTEKQLIMTILVISFLFTLAVMSLENIIVTKIKNKTHKKSRKQIISKTTKIEFYNKLLANMQQDFIGERKIIFNELARM